VGHDAAVAVVIPVSSEVVSNILGPSQRNRYL
jgi:hypothetical protein